jgi:hypothetical protein
MEIHGGEFQERFLAALGEDSEFAAEARWFDGSILVEIGEERLWLKIYRGRVIDTLEFVPVFGYTFKISGSVTAWSMLGSGERTFTDLISAGSRYLDTVAEIEAAGAGYRPPELAIEGNGIEAGRMHIATMHLARRLAETAFATSGAPA